MFHVANANLMHALCAGMGIRDDLVLWGNLVGPTGIEPATSAMSRQRSNQLSYGPKEECEIYTSVIAGASPNTLDKTSDKNYCHIQFFSPHSQGKQMAIKVSPQSFESMRKVMNGFWIVVPAYLLISLVMPFLLALAALLLVAHTLELPIAFLRLRGKNLPAMEVVSKTLLYGFTWWLPRSLEAK